MDAEESAMAVFLSAGAFSIISLFFFPSFFMAVVSIAMSGNMWIAVPALAFIIISCIGMLLIAYFAIIYFVFAILVLSVFALPAYVIYLLIGPLYSLILGLLISGISVLYLLETRTVRIEHHTITVQSHRKYVLKR
jgi:hypothetical protein